MSNRLMMWMSGVLLVLLLGACGAPAAGSPAPNTSQPAPSKTLTVFAAASLTQAFGELGRQFEASHPGVTVTFNYNASQQLRGQLEQGAHADVFASANTKEMTAAIKASVVVSGTQQIFARNRLVVVYPKDNPAKIQSLADLARPHIKLVIADAPVPAGQYTLDMLKKMSADPAYGADFADRVLANVVSREATVEAVANKVRLGEADVAIVYHTDVTRADEQKVSALTIPDQFNQIALYPIAPVVNAPEPDLAQQWITFVLSPAGQQVLTNYGFISAQMAQH